MDNKQSGLARIASFVGFLLLSLGAAQLCADELNATYYDLYFGDLNGDGFDDVYLKAKQRKLLIAGQINVPIKVSFGVSSYAILSNGNLGYAEPVVNENVNVAGLTLDNSRFLEADFNGDGFADVLIHVTSGGVDSFTLAGNAKGLTPILLQNKLTTVAGYELSNAELTIGDLNGDGRSDIIITGFADLVALTDGALVTTAQTFQHPDGTTTVLPDNVGSTAGQFRIDESGSATYQVPIATAAGTAGVAPQISLNYASQSGNGLVGKGWSLGGLSAITRCRQTLFQDQQAKPITWTAEDRFCLDGQRLLVTDDLSYGAVNASYKTETDSFATITAVGGSAGHPNYFTVTRKDGSTSTYGNTTDSKLNASTTKTLTWAQNEFKDSVGNAIDFTYINDASGQRIDTISYAYGDSSGAASSSQTYLQFNYQDRPDNIAGYVGGYSFKTHKLLQNIASYNDDVLIRQYNLGYQASPSAETEAADTANQISKLVRLQELTGVTNTNTGTTLTTFLRPTEFTWAADELGFDPALQFTDFVTFQSGYATVTEEQTFDKIRVSTEEDGALIGYTPADINGDGYMDMAWFDLDIDGEDTDQRFRYMLSDGSRLQHTAFSDGSNFIEFGEDVNETVKMQAIDYNGDGRSDIVLYRQRADQNKSKSAWGVYLSTPQSDGTWKLSSSPIALPSEIKRDALFKDFNSDGLVDVLYWNKNDTSSAALADGNNFYLRHLVRDGSQSDTSSQYYHFGDPVRMNDIPWPDVTARSYTDCAGAGPSCRSNSITTVTTNPNALQLDASSVDFNGDGQSDLVISYGGTYSGKRSDLVAGIKWEKRYALVRDGNSFSLYQDVSQGLPQNRTGRNADSSTPKRAPIFVDINADGLTDIAFARLEENEAEKEQENWYYQLNTGANTGERFTDAVGLIRDGDWNKAQVQFSDYNGDGYPDLLWVSKEEKGADLMLKAWNGSGFAAEVKIVDSDTGAGERNRHLMLDINGDGRSDYARLKTGKNGNLKIYPNKGANKARNVITRISNGLGNQTDIDYGSLNHSGHYENLSIGAASDTQRFDFNYPPSQSDDFYSAINSAWQNSLPVDSQTLGVLCPTLEFNGPVYVVTNVSSSAPVASDTSASSSISYFYGQARLHAAGRGFLGFEKVLTVDEQTGIETSTQYRQDWPFIGYPLITEVRKSQASGNASLLSRAENTWQLKDYSSSWANTAGTQGSSALGSIKPYISQSVEQSYQTNSIVSGSGTSIQISSDISVGALLQTVTTTNDYDDYGNPLSIAVVTTANGDNGAQSFSKTTTNVYGNSDYEREMGRLSRTTVVSNRVSPPIAPAAFSLTMPSSPIAPSGPIAPAAPSEPNLTAPTQPAPPASPNLTAPTQPRPPAVVRAPVRPNPPGAAPVFPTNPSPIDVRNYWGALSAYNSYPARLRAYQTALRAYPAALRAYQSAVATYQTRLGQYQTAQRNYDNEQAAYQAALLAYPAAQQAYEDELAAYQAALVLHQADQDAYADELAEYQSALLAHQAEQQAAQDIYEAELAEYDAALIQHQAEEDAYDIELAIYQSGSQSAANLADNSTRTSDFTYYTSGVLKGLLHTEVIEPDEADYTLTTTHEYDDFGNRIKATQSGGGVTSRYSRSEYDSKGRYVDKTYNAYEQLTEQVISRNAYGAPTELQNIDGVSSFINYDNLGREFKRSSDTGAWSQTLMVYCTISGANCPSDAEYKATTTVAGGGESAEYFDLLGRSIRKASRSFAGGWIHQDSEYDNLGRVTRVSLPYESGYAQTWTVNDYDILGRVIKTTLPDESVSTITYNGLSTTVTNALGQTKTDTKNALGELVEVVDHLGGKAQYSYDVQGSMIQMTALGTDLAIGVNGTLSTTLVYDLLGRKTAMNDPDKGHWQYDYNRFGELTEQRDAKGQKSTMTYDKLGRQITRVDSNAANAVTGNTAWNYNNNLDNSANTAQGNGLSQLLNVTDSITGYIKVISYDSLGRATETATSLGLSGVDGDHYEKVSYDSFGRTLRVYDAARDSDDYTSNGIENRYNDYGYLSKIVDVENNADGTPKQTYYEAKETDVFGNVTEEILGNGYTTQREYDPLTGLQTRMKATLGTSLHTLIDATSQWDVLGNLSQRSQQRYNTSNTLTSNQTETFSYDGLNRLVSATVGGVILSTTFDSFGNIKTKSDVGTYRYAGVGGGSGGPHAVTNTNDGTRSDNYYYDANGNLTRDDTGRTLAYTTFDKPSLITKGNHEVAFEYGPDRGRYKRVDTNTDTNEVTTTLYIGSVEKITRPDGFKEVKRYINGIAIITQTFDTLGALDNTKEHYQYKDHLGSILVMTEQVGNSVAVAQGMGFDPWGQRRNDSNWTAYSAAALVSFDHSITTRGFTGHEMLDEVGLIHMNGRIYDPRLARFVQADPFIQDPGNVQSLNRYSYVLNNPLNATDPSGYFFESIIIGMVIGAIGYELNIPELAAIGSIITCAGGNPYGCAGGSFGATIGAGGDFETALKNGVFAGVSAAAFGEIGAKFNAKEGFWAKGGLGHIGAHALTGGIMAELQGGKFGHGFASAGITKALSPAFSGIGGENFKVGDIDILEAAIAAVIGGTISEATGGKFANGAITAAFGNVYNAQGDNGRGRYPEKGEQGISTEEALDNAQTALDAGGMAPVVGIFADALNTVVSIFRGDFTGAALSTAAMIPGAGQGVTAAKLAKSAGFTKRIPPQKAPFNSHGQPVFTDGKTFITPDVDAHNGGVFKKFNAKGKRLGTFDADLKKIGK